MVPVEYFPASSHRTNSPGVYLFDICQLQTSSRTVKLYPDIWNKTGSRKPSAIEQYAVPECKKGQNDPTKGEEPEAGHIDFEIEEKSGEKRTEQEGNKIAVRRYSDRNRGIKPRNSFGRISCL